MRLMDRVLLLMDDLQAAAHLEMTLRRVGFDVEIITNEFHLSEKLLSFNPDYILAKGVGPRVSTLSVGKKLKDTFKFSGKVILVFPQNVRPTPDDLIQIRMDLLLFDPVSAIRLVANLLSMTTTDKEIITDKLQRLAHTDQQFRNNELQILGGGTTIENEIQIITGKLQSKEPSNKPINEEIDDHDILSFLNPEAAKELEALEESSKQSEASLAEQKIAEQSNELSDEQSSEDSENEANFAVSSAYKQKLMDELIKLEEEIPLRIESYNQVVRKMEIDLKVGLSKKDTKKALRELNKTLSLDEVKKQNSIGIEKQEYIRAMLRKDPSGSNDE